MTIEEAAKKFREADYAYDEACARNKAARETKDATERQQTAAADAREQAHAELIKAVTGKPSVFEK